MDYYVIEVLSGQEEKVIALAESFVPKEMYGSLFYVFKERKKKYLGNWHTETEKCFPGYVFLECTDPVPFIEELKKLKQFARLLGAGNGGNANPISESERSFIDAIMKRTDDAGKRIIPLSGIEIVESDRIKILTGPLKGFEGRIVKLDLHRRKAYIDVDLGGRLVRTELGITFNGINK